MTTWQHPINKGAVGNDVYRESIELFQGDYKESDYAIANDPYNA